MPKSARKNSKAGNTANSFGGMRTKDLFKKNTDIGQHILKNPGVAQAIVDKADLKQSDTVFEVGPGSGNLTVRILDKAKKVIAVELDPRMAAEVTKRVQGTPAQRRLEMRLGDVIKAPLPYFDVCISNTPYQISSPLVFKLLAATPPPRTCVLMFQREFADRLSARPGDKFYSRLSVNAQMWAKIAPILKVGRNNFNPPPQVESTVVRLTPKVPRPQISYDEWDGLLRICFVRKNKTLRASFSGVKVMQMLEANYKTWCSLNDVPCVDGPLENGAESGSYADAMDVEDEAEWPGSMDEDDDVDMGDEGRHPAQTSVTMPNSKSSQNGGHNRKKRGKIYMLVQEKVRKVLEDSTELADKRARMCDETDFLRLLSEFHQEGIHFA